MKLLGGWFSPFAHRIELALKLKGIPYQVSQEDLNNKSSLLLKSNPVYEKISVLVHNKKPISESLVILQYIDETWQHSPLLPQDPYHKALARFWATFIDDKVLNYAHHLLINLNYHYTNSINLNFSVAY